MRRFHRFLLLCLLAIAIPLQGFAAAAATHCEAMPAAMDMRTSMDMHMAHATHADAPADPRTDTHASHAHKGTCSACAACCIVAAPGTAYAPGFGPVPVAIADLSAPSPRVDFLTGGPERPPRTRLA